MTDEPRPPRREPPRLPTSRSRSAGDSLARPARDPGAGSSSDRAGRSRDDSGYRPSEPRATPPSGYGGSGYNTPPPSSSSRSGGGLGASSLTVIAIVALVAFFGGFASRNFLADRGYDDERVVKAQNVPEVFRRFCVDYNGYPSFTVVQLTSVSALTMANVPILRLDTCTIPVNQTANALQALGVSRRAATIGPQLGGSNLTLINAAIGQPIAQALISRYPALAANGDPATALAGVEATINDALIGSMEGLALQNMIRTNMPNVYAMVPGHAFNLQPEFASEP